MWCWCFQATSLNVSWRASRSCVSQGTTFRWDSLYAWVADNRHGRTTICCEKITNERWFIYRGGGFICCGIWITSPPWTKSIGNSKIQSLLNLDIWGHLTWCFCVMILFLRVCLRGNGTGIFLWKVFTFVCSWLLGEEFVTPKYNLIKPWFLIFRNDFITISKLDWMCAVWLQNVYTSCCPAPLYQYAAEKVRYQRS